MNTRLKPRIFAISSSAYRWVMWLWTPPSDSRPHRCRLVPFSFALRTAFSRASFSKKLPSRISFVIRTRSWYTIRPAPRFRCPTSELPICPSGSPTASPLALPVTKGYSCIRASITGVSAWAMALYSVPSRIP